MNACNSQEPVDKTPELITPEQEALDALKIDEVVNLATRRNRLRYAALEHLGKVGTKEYEEKFHAELQKAIESPGSLSA